MSNTLDENIEKAIRDGLANHTGEWLNGFVTKDSYTVEQSSQLLDDICKSKRLNNNIQALITEARIDEREMAVTRIKDFLDDEDISLEQLKKKEG